MKYEIPDREKKNILSVYWQMLREIECHTNPAKDTFNAGLVEAAYEVLNRCGIHDGKPRWKQ